MEEPVDKNVSADSNPQQEEPEGYDKTPAFDLSEYPIDSVLIRTDRRSIFEIIRRIRTDQYILNPDFQRDFVWDIEKQSKLIESVLMRIPLPVLYLAEREDGKIVVVDGLQRLTTFSNFLNNDLSLKGLVGKNDQLNGNKFDGLPPKLQNRIEDTSLILYIIDSKVPERARLDIFERVNGGVPLTRQQMRNCIYMGKATKWLKEHAQSESFIKATGNSFDYRTMRDRECINRFCGFYLLGIEKYVSMDDFLAKTLRHMNKMSDEDLKKLSESFLNSMENNYLVFEKHAFRKHSKPDQSRSIINVSLFDVYSVYLAKYTREQVKTRADMIHSKFYELMGNENFTNSISLGTNDKRRVLMRFECVEKTFLEIFS
ncbi:MAG: DUF262 domain-containing protein [Nitrospirae bacterium]|nr:DUF262 domain-containing protein [Nitrospirota bacterium]